MAPTCMWGAAALQCDVTGAACISWPKVQLKPFGPKLSHNQDTLSNKGIWILVFFMTVDLEQRDQIRLLESIIILDDAEEAGGRQQHAVRTFISPAHQESASILISFLWRDFHAGDVLICPSDSNRTTKYMRRQFIWAKKDLNFQKSCAHLKHGRETQDLGGGAWDRVAHPGLVFWENFHLQWHKWLSKNVCSLF